MNKDTSTVMDLSKDDMLRMRPKTIAELLPELSGLPKHTLQILSSTTKSRPPVGIPHTTEKTFKPMNLAELMATIPGLKNHNNKRTPPKMSTAKKKKWNSSVKLDHKRIVLTAALEAKQSRARKMLTFQSKSDISHFNQNVATDKEQNKTPVCDLRAPQNNQYALDTPLSQLSSGDDSFLQNERKIYGTATNNKSGLATLTPFRKYRKVNECLDESVSSNIDNSCDVYNDTVKSFENVSLVPQAQEDSCIGSLCDLVCKANISETIDCENKTKQARCNVQLLESAMDLIDNFKSSHKTFIESCNVQSSNMINLNENISTLDNITKELVQLKLGYINYLEHLNTTKPNERHNNVNNIATKPPAVNKNNIPISPRLFKQKTYLIPKKNSPLQRKIFKRSTRSPKFDTKAHNMYMDMKKRMDFLHTPISKKPHQKLEDTPTITSHNLQMQLSNLFNES